MKNFVENSISRLEGDSSNILKLMLSVLYSEKVDDSQNIETVLKKLIENRKMSFLEFYRFNNLFKIVNKAEIKIRGNNNYINNLVAGDLVNINLQCDFDWFVRFYDYVGGTSNDVLQELWSKILAGEIKHPQSCSLRTLDIVRNMTANEAQTFQTLCKYICECNMSYIIFDTGFVSNFNGNDSSKHYIESENLNFEKDILPLQECGLISRDRTLAVDFGGEDSIRLLFSLEDVSFILDFTEQIEFLRKEGVQNDILFNENVYFLTNSGKELFKSTKSVEKIGIAWEYIISSFLYYEKKYNAKLEIRMSEGDELFTEDILYKVRKQMEDMTLKDEIMLIELIKNIIMKYKEVAE